MLHRVKDLSPEQRHAAEILLGHPVSEDEAVSIRSVNPSAIIPSKLSPEERIEALKAIDQLFVNRQCPEVNAQEEDAIVGDALRSSRPSYRPIG